MYLNEYQKQAALTAIYPGRHSMFEECPEDTTTGLAYTVLGLTGEAGELANKVKKIMRDGTPFNEAREAMIKELGDVLWYLAMVADELDVSLEQVAGYNLAKLADRKRRGVLGGNGDDR